MAGYEGGVAGGSGFAMASLLDPAMLGAAAASGGRLSATQL